MKTTKFLFIGCSFVFSSWAHAKCENIQNLPAFPSATTVSGKISDLQIPNYEVTRHDIVVNGLAKNECVASGQVSVVLVDASDGKCKRVSFRLINLMGERSDASCEKAFNQAVANIKLGFALGSKVGLSLYPGAYGFEHALGSVSLSKE